MSMDVLGKASRAARECARSWSWSSGDARTPASPMRSLRVAEPGPSERSPHGLPEHEGRMRELVPVGRRQLDGGEAEVGEPIRPHVRIAREGEAISDAAPC